MAPCFIWGEIWHVQKMLATLDILIFSLRVISVAIVIFPVGLWNIMQLMAAGLVTIKYADIRYSTQEFRECSPHQRGFKKHFQL